MLGGYSGHMSRMNDVRLTARQLSVSPDRKTLILFNPATQDTQRLMLYAHQKRYKVHFYTANVCSSAQVAFTQQSANLETGANSKNSSELGGNLTFSLPYFESTMRAVMGEGKRQVYFADNSQMWLVVRCPHKHINNRT